MLKPQSRRRAGWGRDDRASGKCPRPEPQTVCGLTGSGWLALLWVSKAAPQSRFFRTRAASGQTEARGACTLSARLAGPRCGAPGLRGFAHVCSAPRGWEGSVLSHRVRCPRRRHTWQGVSQADACDRRLHNIVVIRQESEPGHGASRSAQRSLAVCTCAMSSANALLRQKAQEGRRATADPGECHSRPRRARARQPSHGSQREQARPLKTLLPSPSRCSLVKVCDWPGRQDRRGKAPGLPPLFDVVLLCSVFGKPHALVGVLGEGERTGQMHTDRQG